MVSTENITEQIDRERDDRLIGDNAIQDVIRKRLLYLEGMADCMEDTQRRALRTWIVGTQKLINDTFPKKK